MKKQNRTKPLIVAAFMSLTGILAAPPAAHAVTHDYVPTYVGCFDNGNCFVEVESSVPSSLTSCSERTQFRWKMSEEGGEAIFKAALAAFLAGHKLRVEMSTACLDGYPWVGHVGIVK